MKFPCISLFRWTAIVAILFAFNADGAGGPRRGPRIEPVDPLRDRYPELRERGRAYQHAVSEEEARREAETLTGGGARPRPIYWNTHSPPKTSAAEVEFAAFDEPNISTYFQLPAGDAYTKVFRRPYSELAANEYARVKAELEHLNRAFTGTDASFEELKSYLEALSNTRKAADINDRNRWANEEFYDYEKTAIDLIKLRKQSNRTRRPHSILRSHDKPTDKRQPFAEFEPLPQETVGGLDKAVEAFSRPREHIRKTPCILVLHNVGGIQQPQFRFSDRDISLDDLLRIIPSDLDPIIISCNSPDFPFVLSGAITTDQALRILSEAVRKMRKRESSELRGFITEAAREVLGSDRAQLYEKLLSGAVASILLIFYAPVPGSEDENWRVFVHPLGDSSISIPMRRDNPPLIWARKQVLQIHSIKFRGASSSRRYYYAVGFATVVSLLAVLWRNRPTTRQQLTVLSVAGLLSLPFIYVFANYMRFIPVTDSLVCTGLALFCLPLSFALARLSAVQVVNGSCWILNCNFSQKEEWRVRSVRLVPFSAALPLGLSLIWNLVMVLGLETFGALAGAVSLVLAIALLIGGKLRPLSRLARL